MSYAIIRNINLKKDNLAGCYKHNERKNTNYSNKDIDTSKSILNYSIKAPTSTYTKLLNNLISQYDLKGRIISTTNVMCEFIVTSDKDYFDSIGEKETKRYFETAYKFVCGYQNLGEENIISAKVHMDESTPHLHLVFVPVVKSKDKNGNDIKKIACSEYWKGKDSYKKLQDNFYNYMTRSGFDLERGNTKDNEHINIEHLKKITDYELQSFEKETSKSFEVPIETNDVKELQRVNKKLVLKFNTVASRYTRIYSNYHKIKQRNLALENQVQELINEQEELEREINKLTDYIEATFEVIKTFFNYPIDKFKQLINAFIRK